MKLLKTILLGMCGIWLFMVGVAVAQSTWADEINNSLVFYKSTYPASNWEPYMEKMASVRDALSKGDQRILRTEMGKFLNMLRNRTGGINDVAADELFNFSLMVTPIEEYKISVPQGTPGIPGLP